MAGWRNGTVGIPAECAYIWRMARFLFLIFNIVLIAAALATGAVFFVIFAALIAAASLFLFLYMRITGRMPGGWRIYRFEQRREESASPRIIEAEFKEVKEERPENR